LSIKKKVFVAVTNDVSTDVRIEKICNYLIDKNFDVLVYGRLLKTTNKVDRKYKILRIKHFFNNHFLFYAEYNIRLLLFLIKFNFDHIISIDLDTLPSCFIISKIKKINLIYDCHEYFTEVPELQNRILVKKIWLFIEGLIIPKLKNAITVSRSISNEYKKKYGIDMNVLRNMPSKYNNYDEENVIIPTKNKFVLYQGVLNPGRGIKQMIRALYFLKNIDLVIIGYGKVENELKQFVKMHKMGKKVFFIGRIPSEKLMNYTKKASVGMVLEEPFGKSFEFSLPNKLFDFIHAEIPIIASSNIEIKKIVQENEVGLVVDNFEPKHIAEKVKLLIDNNELRNRIILNQQKIKNNFYWENDVSVLDRYFV